MKIVSTRELNRMFEELEGDGKTRAITTESGLKATKSGMKRAFGDKVEAITDEKNFLVFSR